MMSPRPEEASTPQNSIAQEMDDADNGNDNATTSDDGPETTGTDDAWAVGRGYTPLSDFTNDDDINNRNTYVMVSTGPGNDSDNDDDDGNWQDGNAGAGTFYVNPNAFGNSIDADSSPAVSCGVDDFKFDDVAASALSALDDDYRQTLVPSHAVSSNVNQEDEDLKIIAAGFDERAKELQRHEEQGGFVAQWEESDGKSSVGVLNKVQQQQQRQKDDDVDTDAVREAVKKISIDNENAPFQQKFAIWQQKQLAKRKQKQIEPHKLIPTSSHNIFREPTPTAKSRLASANLSRSATLAEALVRLSLLSSFQGDLLLIDIVGVDHVECDSALTIRNTFRPFISWLEDYFLASQQVRKIHVHFRLIGRELRTNTTTDGSVIDLLESLSAPSSVLRATATCHSGVYHEFLEEIRESGRKSDERGDFKLLDAKTMPDLAVAFNAGIWGYREWADTIQYLALQQHSTATISDVAAEGKNSDWSGLPMVITAYTLDECQEDQEVVVQSISSTDDGKESTAIICGGYRAEILWESERNPFGSQVVRETKGSTQEYRENACWQAWLLGGKSSRL
jgi:hypothetical protein